MSQSGNEIAAIVEEFLVEDEKFDRGNSAAGTRARKCLMNIKKLCDARRKEIQATKNS